MNKFLYSSIVLSLLVIVAGAVLIVAGDSLPLGKIFGTKELEEVNFETLVVSENSGHYLICPDDICRATTPNETPKIYPLTINNLRDRLFRFIDNNPNIDLRSMDLSNAQFEFTENTTKSPFPDVITVRFFRVDDKKSTLAIYSNSIYHNDATINRDRVKRWLRALESN